MARPDAPHRGHADALNITTTTADGNMFQTMFAVATFITAFGLVLADDDDKWRNGEFIERHNELVEKHDGLITRYNKLVGDWNRLEVSSCLPVSGVRERRSIDPTTYFGGPK
jgi:hypothetical protein